MKPLRILYHHRIRSDDGQAVHVREMIQALLAEGHQVLECALVPKAEATRSTESAPSGRGRLWRHLRLPRVAIETLEVLYNGPGRRRLLAAARDFAPDVLYERHALHCHAGLDAARSLGIPLLLEVNSPMCDEMRALGLLRLPRRARRVEARVLAGADRVLPVSEVLARRLQSLGADATRCRVIRNGADLERFPVRESDPRGRESEDLVLGFVGYVRTWHRLDLILEALAKQPQLGAMRFEIAGAGPARPELEALAARLGVQQRVRWHGEVAPESLPGVLARWDLAVIPAINEYASPLKLFDYLAAGVACVAPRQDNIQELLVDGEEAVLFDPGSPDDVARVLRSLAADPERARALGAAGRQRLIAADWTWRGNARRVADLCRELAR